MREVSSAIPNEVVTRPTWPFPPDDPYPTYARMREEAPVQWSGDLGAWLVLSHAEAIKVLHGTEWSADIRRNPQLLKRLGGQARFFDKMLLFTDSPDHDRLRGAVNRFFTPRRVDELKARIVGTVDAAFSGIERGQQVDLLDEIAYPVPLAVICELLDVGVDTAGLLREETPAMASMLDLLAPPEYQEKAAAAAFAVMMNLVPIAAERRSSPGDDLLTSLLQVLEPDEAIITALLLLAAGHETTSNLIANSTLALAQHPEQLELLRANPGLIPGAVEEMLRFDSPVQVTGRVAREATCLAGCDIAAGDQVIVLLGAANRDPALFDRPEVLDVTRQRPPHLSFGHGAHFCVGANLARAEAAEVLRRLLEVDWTLSGWSRAPSSTFRRLGHLTLTFA